jgi:hypothetical protein
VKKLLLIAIFSIFSISAHAGCTIYSTRTESVAAVFRKYGGWDLSDVDFNQLCEKLKRANARISISSDAVVLGNQSIGWAILSVMDIDTGITALSGMQTSTFTNPYASQDKAEELMFKAINDAAKGWNNIDEALFSLDNERKKVRSVFGKQR